jgi:hypothetical protein
VRLEEPLAALHRAARPPHLEERRQPLEATHSRVKPARLPEPTSEDLSPVLVAIAALGSGTLPFMGFPIWAAVVVALIVVIAGLALRRLARAKAAG